MCTIKTLQKRRRQRLALRVETAQLSAFNAKRSGWVRMCEWQQACMRLILITFYKNINGKMFTSATRKMVQFEGIHFYSLLIDVYSQAF